MMALLEKLIDLLASWVSYLVPWAILGDDQCGLIRRLGVFHRYMSHGINWKIPVIEQALCETSALDSTVLREQSLTTSDGVQITLRGVITYRVVDAKRYILECDHAESVVNDVGCCVIAEMIPTLTAEEVLRGEAFNRELLRKVRARGKRWGVEVDSFGLVDRVQARVYRIITSAAPSGGSVL